MLRLECFGKIQAEFVYTFVKLGYATDCLELELKLRKHS